MQASISARLLVHSFQKRNALFQIMRAVLHLCDLPISRGWDETAHKIIEHEADNNFQNKVAQLEVFYKNHLLVGEKAVKLFHVNAEKLLRLKTTLLELSISDSSYREKYPFSLTADELKMIDATPVLVDVREVRDSCAVIFCTKRTVIENVKLSPQELSENLQNAYDEIIGKKKETKQFFDVIFIRPTQGVVEVRIDIGKHISRDDRAFSFSQTEDVFNRLCREIGLEGKVLSRGINVFPAIESLYRMNEGMVCEVSFKTDEGSTKNEKMRKSHIDLREETYHSAGRQAIEDANSRMQMYKIAITLEHQVSEGLVINPELLLPGRKVELSKLTPMLEEFLVTKCMGLDDYDFIFDKMILYSNNCG